MVGGAVEDSTDKVEAGVEGAGDDLVRSESDDDEDAAAMKPPTFTVGGEVLSRVWCRRRHNDDGFERLPRALQPRADEGHIAVRSCSGPPFARHLSHFSCAILINALAKAMIYVAQDGGDCYVYSGGCVRTS